MLYPIPLQGLLLTTGPDPDELSLIQSLVTVLAVTVIYVYLIASVYPWLTMHLAWRKRIPYSDRATQGSNPGLPHCRWLLYRLSHLSLSQSFCISFSPRFFVK